MSLGQRFEKFLLSLPSVEGIDSIALNEVDRKAKKADYLAMGRKFVIEQKCINEDQTNKIQNEVEKYSNTKEYPVFYGKRDLNFVLEKLPNKEEVKRNIYSRATKMLESYLRQADKQIESTQALFNLKAACGVLLILNDKVKVLSPEIVITRIQQRLKETRNGSPRFNNIDYVIYVSETHNVKGMPVIIVIEGANTVRKSSEISDYIDYLIHSWGQFNGGGCHEFQDNDTYAGMIEENKEPIPEKMTRSEARILWYRENRYMKTWTNDQVAMKAAALIDRIQPFVLKGGPKMPQEKLAELMIQFGDFIEESNLRGLDIREFSKFHQK
ncbi:hypothetical protein GV054_13890 [Marinomonas mediterranea]|uniref:hypothetical protein n=1 Tax=Marinomonas mediterranea TaxID=119864 RepID=UPI00234A8FC5|nr:hypothetical protein [Marinomonas mediterranea]WCN14011.1 hypothetical protein GV054_13890 [Marinomonas mediterranea]